MPPSAGPLRVSATLGEDRPGLSRHSFRGGNAWMLRVLTRHREGLGVATPGPEMDRAVEANRTHLASDAATLALAGLRREDGRLVFEVVVRSLAGHKLPTAYPSRRAWLHVVVRDAGGAAVFESGAPVADGSIRGNDNDADASRFEPHHREITSGDDVQVYESILADAAGKVTTGLLKAVAYAKDNRLLPEGFDKAAAEPDVAVRGEAVSDPDFGAGGDHVLYRVPAPGEGPLRVEAELLYQSIGFRWARNLAAPATAEGARFLALHESMAGVSAERLAVARAELR